VNAYDPLDLDDLIPAVGHLQEAGPVGERRDPLAGVQMRLQPVGKNLLAGKGPDHRGSNGGRWSSVIEVQRKSQFEKALLLRTQETNSDVIPWEVLRR